MPREENALHSLPWGAQRDQVIIVMMILRVFNHGQDDQKEIKALIRVMVNMVIMINLQPARVPHRLLIMLIMINLWQFVADLG